MPAPVRGLGTFVGSALFHALPFQVHVSLEPPAELKPPKRTVVCRVESYAIADPPLTVGDFGSTGELDVARAVFVVDCQIGYADRIAIATATSMMAATAIGARFGRNG
jgi:hypothetical protein